jgi:hypothetical protein
MPTGLTEEQYQRVLAILWEGKEISALQSAVELHQLAWNWNWDDSRDVPGQIIRHPLCDRSTALLIYWRAGPRWFYQFATRDEVAAKADWGLDDYDLIKEIEKRYLAGVYTQAGIAFDPSNENGYNWTTSYKDLESKQTIPEMLKMPSPGRVLDRAAF